MNMFGILNGFLLVSKIFDSFSNIVLNFRREMNVIIIA